MGIKVAVIDDQDIIRLGVQQSLANIPYITFVAGFSDVASFCHALSGETVDVVLLDDSLPDITVFQAIQVIHEQCLQVSIVVLGSRLTANDMHRVVNCGASGIVCKNEPVQDMLLLGIRHAQAGRVYLSPGAAIIAGRIGMPETVIAPRVQQVLHLIARGFHVQDIAQELDISPRAVYSARARLREVLGVETNEQIVVEAVRRGLLSDSE